MNSKIAYEKLANAHGVKVEAYHADNGEFAEKGFREVIANLNQAGTFCRVGSHHQNALVEQYIQQITKMGRTVLLHAKRDWKEAIGTILWPFAIKAVEDMRNDLKLNEKGWAPIHHYSKLFSNIEIKHWHTWDCPVFVLDTKAQSGHLPKWDPKARVGIYLGYSPCRAGSVALVLNLKTLHVSPQYHVVFYDKFITVPYMKSGEVPRIPILTLQILGQPKILLAREIRMILIPTSSSPALLKLSLFQTLRKQHATKSLLLRMMRIRRIPHSICL